MKKINLFERVIGELDEILTRINTEKHRRTHSRNICAIKKRRRESELRWKT